MGLPNVSFKDFVKNPISALLFMCLMAIGYLYFTQTTSFNAQIERLENDIKILKKDNKELNEKIIEILTEVRQN